MFDIARSLYAAEKLDKIITGFPKNRLKKENLPTNKIKSYPIYQLSALIIAKGPLGTTSSHKYINDRNKEYLDSKAVNQIGDSNLISMSSLGLRTARLVKKRGNIFIVNRWSHHIVSQRQILEAQTSIWGWPELLPSEITINRELEEYQLADKIIVPSKASRDSFRNQGIEMSKIIINPFPLSAKKLRNSNPHKKDILFVGNVTLQKGFPTLIQAFNLLNLVNVKLHVVGIYSKPFVSFLKNCALSFENILLHGPLDTNRLKKLYEATDVFVLPSIHDGWGMVVNEAMSHGCIPIVSTGAGASDQIEHGINGYVFEAGDAVKLADCILKALDNKELRSSMILNMNTSPYFNRTWDDFCRVYINEN